MTDKEKEKYNQIYQTYEYDPDGHHGYFDDANVENIFEFGMLMDEKIMNYEVSLIIEIDGLFEKGYCEEKIFNLIMNAEPLVEDLDNDKNYFLKKRAIKLLKIRSALYMQSKDANRLSKIKHIYE